MKKFIQFIILSAILMLTMIAFAACNSSQTNSNTCAVTFNAMDGSEAQVVTVTKGEKVASPKIDLREGYTFKGWYISTEFTSDGEWSFIGYTVTEDMMLYAYWMPNVYSITYKEIDGAAFSSDNDSILPTEHTYDTQTNLPIPTKDNHIFIGWYLDGNDTSSPITSLTAKGYTSDITLYAKWVKATYNIEYKDCGGTKFSGDNKSSLPAIHSYATQTELPNGTKMGYDFIGWYLNKDCDGEKTTSIKAESITEDIVLYAKWEGKTTYIDENGVTQTLTNAPIKVLKAGQSNSLINTYKINGWYLFSGKQRHDFHYIEVDDIAYIILEDGSDCSLFDLIVNEGSTLYIFSQSFSDGMGKLSINSNLGGQTGMSLKAAYGGGSIVICGGHIIAKSIGGGDALSMYGDNGGDSGNITIYNGKIEATRIGGGNGYYGESANYFNTSNEKGGNGGNGGSVNTITVYGGSVVAEVFGGGNGGKGGSASGTSAGGDGGRGGSGGSLIIYGGHISLDIIRGGNGGNGGYGGTPNVGLGGNGGNGGNGGKGTNVIINSADTSTIFSGAIQLVGGDGGNGGNGGSGSSFNTDGNGGNGGNSATGGTMTINGEDTVDYTITNGKVGTGGSGKINGSDGILA